MARALLLLMLTSLAAADGLVIGLTRSGQDYHLTTSGKVHSRTHLLPQHQLAIDLSPARLATPTPGLRQLNAHTVRLQVSTLHHPIYQITPNPHGLTLALSSHRPRPGGHRINLDLVDADLIQVVKVLAKEMHRDLYIGCGVEGRVSLSLRDVAPEAALDMTLKMSKTSYKLTSDHLIIVAAPEKLDQIDEDILRYSCLHKISDQMRCEILCEYTPAAKIIGFLQTQFKNVEFIPHPTMNGFYVVGSRADILAIKNDVPNLDHVPDVPPPPISRFVKINYGDPNEVKSLLVTLVPDVEMTIENGGFILAGSPGAIDQAMELIDQLDKPLDQVVIECKLVQLTQTAQQSLNIPWANLSWGTSSLEVLEPTSVKPDGIPTAKSDCVWGQPLAPSESDGFSTLPQTRLERPFRMATVGHAGLKLQANPNPLAWEKECKLLARRSVSAQSGTEAQVRILDLFPLVYFNPSAGQFQEYELNLGLKLDVTVSVRSDGSLECKIQPEVRSMYELLNQRQAIGLVRRVSTDARLKDGETLALGGLFDEPSAPSIPLLAELPILGVLYRPSIPPLETILFLTPHVMK